MAQQKTRSSRNSEAEHVRLQEVVCPADVTGTQRCLLFEFFPSTFFRRPVTAAAVAVLWTGIAAVWLFVSAGEVRPAACGELEISSGAVPCETSWAEVRNVFQCSVGQGQRRSVLQNGRNWTRPRTNIQLCAARVSRRHIQTRRLTQAKQLLKEQRYTEAVRLLQEILDSSEDILLWQEKELQTEAEQQEKQQPQKARLKEPAETQEREEASTGPLRTQTVKSLKQQAELLLEQLPPKGLAAYRLQFAQKAQQELTDALNRDDWTGVREVAQRFFHTKAGQEAAYFWACACLDRGRAFEAALWLERLKKAKDLSSERQRLVLLKAAVAWAAAGVVQRARQCWQEGAALAAAQQPDSPLGRSKTFEEFKRLVERLWPATTVSSQSQADQWLTYRGNFARTADAQPVNVTGPLAWSQSTLMDAERFQAESLSQSSSLYLKILRYARISNWQRARSPRLPALFPLVVGQKVVCRTVNGVQAFDLNSGKLLWQSVLLDPTLAEINRQLQQTANVLRASYDRLLPNYLDQRWFLDTTTGTLSSDGRNVYAVEESKLLGRHPPIGLRSDQERLFYSRWNRLAAIDVETGRLRWLIGGPEGRPSSLSGVFFLGPPVVSEKTLYCLAQDDDETLLLAIAPTDGSLIWALTLDSLDKSQQPDLRWFYTGNVPALYENVLVCPLPSGAVVAVDVDSRRPLWCFRYRDKTASSDSKQSRLLFGPAVQLFISSPGGNGRQIDRWVGTVPQISYGRVLVTPPDLDKLVCLDLLSGRVCWQRPREHGLFVAAVTNQQVVVVSPSQVFAWRLEDGQPGWPRRLSIPAPAGQGIRVQHYYHLPLTTSEILTFDLDDGRVLARTAVPQHPLLGNLAAGHGTLVVQSWSSVSAFRSFAVRWSELQGAGVTTNAEQLAQLAEFHLHCGKLEEGMKEVRRSLKLATNDKALQLLKTRLFDDLQRDFPENYKKLAELEPLIQTPQERIQLLCLKAEGLLKLGQVQQALDVYLTLGLDTASSSAEPLEGIPQTNHIWEHNVAKVEQLPFIRSEDGLVKTRVDCWVRARLAELYRNADAQTKKQINRRLAERLTQLKPNDPFLLKRFVSCTRWLPIAETAEKKWVNELLKTAPSSLELELELRRLSRSNDPDTAAFACAALAERYLQTGRLKAAWLLTQRLAGPLKQALVRPGVTAEQWVQRWRSNPNVAQQLALVVGWPPLKLNVELTQDANQIDQVLKIPQTRKVGEPFADWSFQWRRHMGSVVALDAWGRIRYTLPVPNLMLAGPYFGGLKVETAGNLLLLSLGDRFVVCDTSSSPSNRVRSRLVKMLWGFALVDRELGSDGWRSLRREVLIRPGGGGRVMLLDQRGRPVGTVKLIADTIVCYQTGTTLYASEAQTGRLLWLRKNVARGTEIFGDEHLIVLYAHQTQKLLFFRTDDGQWLGTKSYPLSARKRLATVGHCLLTWSSSEHGSILSLLEINPKNDQLVWQRQFPAHSLATMVDSDRVAVLDRQGHFFVLAAKDGTVLTQSRLKPPANASHVFVVPRVDRYLVFTPTLNITSLARVSGMPYMTRQVLVNGRLEAVDQQTGKVLWTKTLNPSVLDIEQPRNLPVLIFACRKTERLQPKKMEPTLPGLPSNQAAYSLWILDIRTGQFLFQDDDFPSMKGFEVQATEDLKHIRVLTDQATLKLSYSNEPLKAQNK